jgi:hypothetical protein
MFARILSISQPYLNKNFENNTESTLCSRIDKCRSTIFWVIKLTQNMLHPEIVLTGHTEITYKINDQSFVLK